MPSNVVYASDDDDLYGGDYGDITYEKRHASRKLTFEKELIGFVHESGGVPIGKGIGLQPVVYSMPKLSPKSDDDEVVDTSSYDCDKVDVFSMKMMLAASKREIRLNVEAAVREREIGRLKEEIEKLKVEGKADEARRQEVALQAEEIEKLKREICRLKAEGRGQEAAVLMRSASVSGVTTPALDLEMEKMLLDDEADVVVNEDESKLCDELEKLRLFGLSLNSSEIIQSVIASDGLEIDHLLNVVGEAMSVPKGMISARWASHPRGKDVEVVPDPLPRETASRNRSSSPMKIKKETTRNRLFARRQGRPRQPLRGYDDAKNALMAMMHVRADVADFNTQLKVMDALQRYYRKRHQAKIRMRRYRARLKGWEFDEIAQRAIVPPEELARREEMRKKKEEKAARRGKRGRPRGSRGSRGRGRGSTTGEESQGEPTRRAARGRGLKRRGVDRVSSAAKRGKGMERIPNVSTIEKALRDEPSKYHHWTKEQMEEELFLRDSTIEQLDKNQKRARAKLLKYSDKKDKLRRVKTELLATKEELETAGSVAQSMKRMATGATADGCVWDVYSERINDIRMQRRENIDKLFLLPDFYLSDSDIDYAAERRVPFASSISSSDGSNGDRGDSRSDLSETERAKLKEQFRMKEEQMKEQRRRKRELYAERRSKRRARKLNRKPSDEKWGVRHTRVFRNAKTIDETTTVDEDDEKPDASSQATASVVAVEGEAAEPDASSQTTASAVAVEGQAGEGHAVESAAAQQYVPELISIDSSSSDSSSSTSDASEASGNTSLGTEESGDYHMGRTSPISSMGGYASSFISDNDDGWIGDGGDELNPNTKAPRMLGYRALCDEGSIAGDESVDELDTADEEFLENAKGRRLVASKKDEKDVDVMMEKFYDFYADKEALKAVNRGGKQPKRAGDDVAQEIPSAEAGDAVAQEMPSAEAGDAVAQEMPSAEAGDAVAQEQASADKFWLDVYQDMPPLEGESDNEQGPGAMDAEPGVAADVDVDAGTVDNAHSYQDVSTESYSDE